MENFLIQPQNNAKLVILVIFSLIKGKTSINSFLKNKWNFFEPGMISKV
jgi:hypothetical protein